MKTLYFDAYAGISGDMSLAALIDLGVPIDYLRQELAKLELPAGSYEISTSKANRQGMYGLHINVEVAVEEHHRHYGKIREMIAESGISDGARLRAQKIFALLAEAEAEVHQVEVEKVHFHEVGALDSIIDIVGVAICLDWLGIEKIHVSALPLGGGFVDTAHGRLSVPAPATMQLLKGLQVHGNCGEGERVTPTGAAIVAALAERCGPMPAMTVTATGNGAGGREYQDCPNILRVFAGVEESVQESCDLLEVSCNLDDVTAEVIGFTKERLFGAGALDVWATAIQMKKNRPGTMISFLCRSQQLEELSKILMDETGTLGVRFHTVQRKISDRRIEYCETQYGQVRIKYGSAGAKPEFEDCVEIAKRTGEPLKNVMGNLLASLAKGRDNG